MPAADRQRMLQAWDFPWPIMDVLIGGKSSIDLGELRVTSFEEATEFLRSYGYDPDDPADRRTMHAVLVEATAFIERKLLTPREWRQGIRPSEEILACSDPRQLMVWASDPGPANSWRQAWACALLRVMHTIAHIEGVTRHHNIEEAREQIMGRFQRYLTRDQQGRLWLGEGENRIRLERVEWKNMKTRDSTLLKLLHKRDNVAETIYDLIGVRLVTARFCDVMMAVKYLRQFHIVTFPNCVPARARNNLVDVERFKAQVEALRAMLEAGSIEPREFETMINRLAASDDVKVKINAHSASTYRSIQLTCRQLIRTESPEFAWLEKMKEAVERLPSQRRQAIEELAYLIETWQALKEARSVSAFFPFEVQIMDGDSYREASRGLAAHAHYKKSQIRAARRRVLHQVFEVAKTIRGTLPDPEPWTG